MTNHLATFLAASALSLAAGALAAGSASAHGYVDHVEGAGHNTLLGPLYADHIVKGVEFVLSALKSPPGSPGPEG